jgi:hypothetical protein
LCHVVKVRCVIFAVEDQFGGIGIRVPEEIIFQWRYGERGSKCLAEVDLVPGKKIVLDFGGEGNTAEGLISFIPLLRVGPLSSGDVLVGDGGPRCGYFDLV